VQKVGRHAASEAVILGLTAHLRRLFPRIGFFKPVGTNYYPLDGQQYPRNVVLMHQHFKMRSDPSLMSAMSEDSAFKVFLFLGLCFSHLQLFTQNLTHTTIFYGQIRILQEIARRECDYIGWNA
jgi:hypothetical protein